MSESTIRSGRRKGFFVLYRAAAQDDRLSLEARGLFSLMMSLPEDWSYSVSGLAVKAGCGKDRIRRLLRELQEVGYLVREQSHGQGGKFGGNVYVLQDEAPPLSGDPDNGEGKKAPLSGNTVNGENRQREKPLTDLPTLQNRDLTEEKTKRPPKPPEGGRRSRYELAEDAKPILRAYVGDDQELARAMADFIQTRTELRAINSARAVRMLLVELDRLSGGRREDKLRLIRQSVTNSWKSVFPLRGAFQQAPAAGPPAVVRSEVLPVW